MRATFLLMPALAAALALPVPAPAADAPTLERQDWSWSGWHTLFGQYDRAQLRRGFQVYREICSNCHSLNLVAYRNLADLGFTADQIRAIAAEKSLVDGLDDQGDPVRRPATAADRFVPPFANEPAARAANNGALPPDLSLIVKARKGGPDYVYGLLTGFVDPPEGFAVADGMYYNRAFPGHQIAMPPQIADDQVAYDDGTKASAGQIARDAVAFLNWTAEPELDTRHRLGIKVLLFLLVLTVLFIALKRRVWSDLHK